METSRLKEMFETETFYKIVSIFIAILLWAYVSFVLDPEIQKEVTNIPVRFTNESELVNAGLTLVNSDFTVDFEIKGRRNLISSLNKDRIWAEADLSDITKLGRNRVALKVQGIPATVQVVKELDDIYIELDKLYSTRKNITISIKGEPQKGYAVLNPTANPVSVKIDGSQKLINSIFDVNVSVDVSNLDNTYTSKENIAIIDSKGEKIKGLKSDIEVADITVPIVKAKEVSLKPQIKGVPRKDSNLGGVTINPQKALITGNDDILGGINELKLEQIDIRGASKTITGKVKIIIPQGVTLVNSDGLAEVTVKISKQISKKIQISSSNIQINDQKADYDYKITKFNIDVNVEGLEDDINKLDTNLISGSISVKTFNEGDHTAPMILNLPDNIKQRSIGLVPINVSKK